MASPRGNVPAGTYHVTTRSGGPIPIFIDDQDRTCFCMLLMRTIKRARWICHSFCLMTTHYHLLLEVPEDALQGGMHVLNGNYAMRFNARHGRSGHLFGERYCCRRVASDGHLLQLLRYIARNPVEAGLVARPSDWYWSSYRGCAALDAGFPFVDSSFVRSYFGADREQAVAQLRAFVGDDDASVP